MHQVVKNEGPDIKFKCLPSIDKFLIAQTPETSKSKITIK